MSVLDKIFGSNEREIRKVKPLVDKINLLEPQFEKLSDEELKAKTAEFKTRLQKRLSEEWALNQDLDELPAQEKDTHQQHLKVVEQKVLDEVLPEAFALVREAAKRTIGQRHFDVQLLGGIVLHQGKISEMRTGEGKTLVATLPLYLNALLGKGAHLVTVNDYLAKRDAGWMGQIYYKLGFSTAFIGHEISFLFDPNETIKDETDERLAHFRPVTRQEAYRADITYGTNNEFGFDYLRDNMVQDVSQLVQRELHFAIVDEVDSILIDEARTPLIISAPAEESASMYARFAQLVPNLQKEKDYKIDEKARAVTLTDEGIARMEQLLGVKNIYEEGGIALVHHLEEALKAHALFQKDKDYVVKDGEVVIVDEFTGRLMPGRRYSEGLHQAIEAKEGVEVKRESDTLATISFQNLFRMYSKLSGMTGTAATEAEEFYKIYKLDVVEIPTHQPMIRSDYQDKVYKTATGKFKAAAQEIKERYQRGQPILIGTLSIEKSEYLSRMLSREGIRHEVLNAKHHEREAKIIEKAGRSGAVTVATNMAGRGVDIVLGGKPPSSKDSKEKFEQWEKAHQEVIKAGGLHVIGTERHEARRIDNQLRGRSGRQGDPGTSQFFVSMEDDLMRVFGGDRMKRMMDTLRVPEDMPIQHKLISRSIESAQRRVEGHNFDIRKHLVEYDDVMNKHREVIYRRRRRILESKDLKAEVLELMEEAEKAQYSGKEKQYGPDVMRQLEKMVFLRTIDMLWIEHLNSMEQLREGIGLRGYGQRDPLIEYKQEAYHLFQRLIQTINDEVVNTLLRIELRAPQPFVQAPAPTQRAQMSMQGGSEQAAAGTFAEPPVALAKGGAAPVSPVAAQASPFAKASGDRPPATVMAEPAQPSSGVQVSVYKKSETASQPSGQTFVKKVGRNEPCPCGSGKKYKKCHGRFV